MHNHDVRRVLLLTGTLSIGLSLALMLLTACAGFASRLSGWRTSEEAPRELRLTVLAPDDSAAFAQQLEQSARGILTAHSPLSLTVAVEPLTEERMKAFRSSLQPADLLILDAGQVPEMVDGGYLAPLALDLPAAGEFEPQLAAASTVSNTVYCAPLALRSLALFYNRTLFDQAGLAAPVAGWRWDDLRTAAEQISGLPVVHFSAFGLVLTPDLAHLLPFVLQAGGQPTPIDAESWSTALTFVRGLYTDTLSVTPSYFAGSWSGEVFGNGRAGMTVEGPWLVPYLAAHYPELAYGIAPLPAGPQGAATVVFGACIAVSARSEHPVEAAALATGLVSASAMPALLAAGDAMPARPALWPAWQEEHPAAAQFVAQMPIATLWRAPVARPAVATAFNRSMQDWLAGDADIETLLATTRAAMEQAVEPNNTR